MRLLTVFEVITDTFDGKRGSDCAFERIFRTIKEAMHGLVEATRRSNSYPKDSFRKVLRVGSINTQEQALVPRLFRPCNAF